jgi:hypothetical protein
MKPSLNLCLSEQWFARLWLGLLLSLAFLSEPAVLRAATSWDGQYELVGGGPGGVPYHHYLLLYTPGRTSRIILNGKELSRVSVTDTGFRGAAGGQPLSGTFVNVQGTNAILLDRAAELTNPINQVEPGGQPWLQTKGPGEVGVSFKQAKAMMKDYDRFLARFRSVLTLPDEKCLRVLQPVFDLPIHDSRPEADGNPVRQREIKELTVEFVRSLKVARYRQASSERSLTNGPFDYRLWPAHCSEHDPAALVLLVEPCHGKLRITTILYVP